MKAKITKSFIESVEPPEKSELLVWDVLFPGFYVTIRPSGRKSFYAFYRLRNHKQQKIKLGDFPMMTVEEARDKYKELTNQVFDGLDPAAVIRERAKIEEFDPSRNGLVVDLYEKYMAEHAIYKKPRSRDNDRLYWNKHIIPRIGTKEVRAVTVGDISAIHKGISQETGRGGILKTTTANRVLEVLKKAFTLAEEWEWRHEGSNPCRKIKKFKERARRRYLGVDEAGKLGNVLQKYLCLGYRERQIARLVLLLIYTGARRSEILTAKWKYVSPERFVLAIPDSKSNEPQDIQLPSEAFDLLEDIRADQEQNKRQGEYIFDGHIKGQPLKDEGVHWDKIRSDAALSDFRMHDLRHSFASFMAITTGSQIMIQRTLRHADQKTSERYTHLFNDPVRLAVNQTASKIKQALNGKVINFDEAKKIRGVA